MSCVMCQCFTYHMSSPGCWRTRTGRRRKGVSPEEETGLCWSIPVWRLVEASPWTRTLLSVFGVHLQQIDRYIDVSPVACHMSKKNGQSVGASKWRVGNNGAKLSSSQRQPEYRGDKYQGSFHGKTIVYLRAVIVVNSEFGQITKTREQTKRHSGKTNRYSKGNPSQRKICSYLDIVKIRKSIQCL